MKIGIIIDSIMLGIEDGIDKAAALGVQGIQFFAVKGDMDPVNLGAARRKEILDYVKSNNLVVSAVCGDFGGHGFERAADNPKRIEKSKQILDLARDLECNIVTTHIGVVHPPNTEIGEAMLCACRELGEFAKSVDGFFAVETGPETASELKCFLDQVGSRGMAVNYDPANLLMVTGDDPVAGVQTLKDYIVHTHAKDGRMLKKSDPITLYNHFAEGGIGDLNLANYFREHALGEGEVDFPRYLQALESIGYGGFLTIERELGDNPLEDIRRSVKYLQSLEV